MLSMIMANTGDVSVGETDPAKFFGFMGVATALVFANLGAAYGTAKSGVGICSMGVLKPDLIIRSVIPVVMAGILGIYGLIVSVILIQKSIFNSNVFSLWSRRKIHLRNGILPPCCRTVLWSELTGIHYILTPGSWYCHRNSRGCWCKGARTTRKNIRRNDAYPHLR
jgi:ATP synthase proteolipid subunit